MRIMIPKGNKIMIHKDNKKFWKRACEIAIKNIKKQREQEQEEYIKLPIIKKIFRVEPNPKKGERLYWREEVELEGIRNLFCDNDDVVCLTTPQIGFILHYADLEYNYNHFYDKNKDKVVKEYT